jgi:hypothetical protein
MAKLQINMFVLKSGSRSIRFRPTLTFSKDDLNIAALSKKHYFKI